MQNTNIGPARCRTLIIRFKNELRFSEIPFFRGAVIHATAGNDILFHNHVEDGYRYSYPLIQYKCIGGKAAILCVGEGTDSIGSFFSGSDMHLTIGNRETILQTEQVYAHQTIVQVWNDSFTYNIRKWLPFNQENYRKYLEYDSLSDKYRMLEKLLVGNILSFAKGVGICIDKEIHLAVKSCNGPKIMTYKGVKMNSFDLEFSTNVLLPDFIGLGKGASHGFGTVHKA